MKLKKKNNLFGKEDCRKDQRSKKEERGKVWFFEWFKEMGISQNEAKAKMEGWLYTLRSNRFGLQFSRKRYFILHNNVLKSYKAIPISDKEVTYFILFYLSFLCLFVCLFVFCYVMRPMYFYFIILYIQYIHTYIYI